MREIKKEIIRKEYQTIYIATDGTEFHDRNECEKYEKSAMGVLNSRYMELVTKSMTEEDLNKSGSCENTIEIIKITNTDDIDVVAQLYCLTHSYENTTHYVDRVRELCKKALETRDYLIVSRGYDYDNLWVIDTLTDYLNYILKQCDPGSKIRIEDEDDTAE